jgi:signal transduction histidine kinase
MQLSQALALLSAIFTFLLGNFTFWGNRKQKINIVFALFCFGSTIWFFGTFMMFVNRANIDLALFWDRVVYIGVALLPVFMYHLSLILTRKKENKTLYIGYVILSLFLVLSQTKYFVNGIYEYSWGVHSQAGILHHFFLLTFFVYVVLFYFNIYLYYRNTTNRLEKVKLRLVLIAFIFLTLGALGYLPAYGIDIYPFSYFFGVVFVIIFAYAILKLRFISIRLVVKKTTIYVTSLITTVLSTLIFWWILNNAFEVDQNHIFIITLIFALVITTPLHKLIEKYSNKYLFYSLENYQQTIIALANKLNTIINLNEIIDLVVDTIKETMSLDRSGVLLINDSIQPVKYQIAKVVGFNRQNGISLVQDNFLTQYLTKNQKPLVREELDFLSDQSETEIDKKSFLTLKEHMSKIEAFLCLPLISQTRLAGIIVLGAKLSGEAYTKEDFDLLTTLSNQAAIAITNARYYKETQDFNKTLQTKVDEQTKDIQEKAVHLEKLLKMRSEFLDIASHQLRTPTSVIKGTLAMMKEGDMEKMSSEDKAKFVEGMFQKSVKLESIINDILVASEMDTADFDIETKDEIELDKFLEKEVNEHQFDAAEKKLTLTFEKLTDGPFKIKGSLKYLEQVIDNLLNNALKYTPQGFVKASIKKEGNSAIIAISDSGIGILKDDLKRIFNKFIRGKNARNVYTDGSGLGLFIIKRIMDRHPGSKVWVESPVRQALTAGLAGGEEGKGSTFYLQFPLLK